MFDLDVWGRATSRRRPDLEEPEWDTGQRSWMLALAYVEAHECPGCGGWRPETTDPRGDPNNPAREFDWVVSNPSRCHRCTALANKAGPYQKDAPHSHALSFRPERVPRRRPGG